MQRVVVSGEARLADLPFDGAAGSQAASAGRRQRQLRQRQPTLILPATHPSAATHSPRCCWPAAQRQPGTACAGLPLLPLPDAAAVAQCQRSVGCTAALLQTPWLLERAALEVTPLLDCCCTHTRPRQHSRAEWSAAECLDGEKEKIKFSSICRALGPLGGSGGTCSRAVPRLGNASTVLIKVMLTASLKHASCHPLCPVDTAVGTALVSVTVVVC